MASPQARTNRRPPTTTPASRITAARTRAANVGMDRAARPCPVESGTFGGGRRVAASMIDATGVVEKRVVCASPRGGLDRFGPLFERVVHLFEAAARLLERAGEE